MIEDGILIHSHRHKPINTLAHAHKQKLIRHTENVSPERKSSRKVWRWRGGGGDGEGGEEQEERLNTPQRQLLVGALSFVHTGYGR